MAKRRVDVFTAGCHFCDPVVQLVELACPHCEVNVHDVREAGGETAQEYGLTRVRTVVVDGTIAAPCHGPVSAEQLQAAGIGQRRAQ